MVHSNRRLKQFDVVNQWPAVDVRLWIGDAEFKYANISFDYTGGQIDSYEKGAIIPAGEVTSVGLKEVRSLIGPAFSDPCRTIGIIYLGDRCSNPQEWILERLSHRQAVVPFPRQDLVSNLRGWKGGENAEWLGLHYSIPSQPTLTLRRGRGNDVPLRIGLHLDNWDKNSFENRRQSRNRLAVNLGPGNRELIVVAHDVLARLQGLKDNSIPTTKHVRQYAMKEGPLVIMRLTIPPGFAYIAATDYLVHDGSTYFEDSGSWQAVFLGHFRPVDHTVSSGPVFVNR